MAIVRRPAIPSVRAGAAAIGLRIPGFKRLIRGMIVNALEQQMQDINEVMEQV